MGLGLILLVECGQLQLGLMPVVGLILLPVALAEGCGLPLRTPVGFFLGLQQRVEWVVLGLRVEWVVLGFLLGLQLRVEWVVLGLRVEWVLLGFLLGLQLRVEWVVMGFLLRLHVEWAVLDLMPLQKGGWFVPGLRL